MKFDELIEKSKALKAPEFKKDFLSKKENESSVKSFIEILKQKDYKYKRQLNTQLYILGFTSFIILGLIMFIGKIIDLVEIDIYTMRLGFGFLYGCYIVSIFMFYLRSRGFKNINYDQEIIQFLGVAKKRYSYFNSNKLFYIPIIILLNLGLYFTLLPIIDLININKLTLIVNLELILVCTFVIDLILKFSIWKRNQKPIFIEISKLLGEV